MDNEGLKFIFKDSLIKIEAHTLAKYPKLRLCSSLNKKLDNIPRWMEPASLKLFIGVASSEASGRSNQEEFVGQTSKILRMLWYSDYFGIDDIQRVILMKHIFRDLHVLNAAVYLHEGLKKIANTKNISPEWWFVIEKANSTFKYGLLKSVQSEKARKFALELSSIRSTFSCLNYHCTLEPEEIRFTSLEPHSMLGFFTKSSSRFKTLDHVNRKQKELTSRGYRETVKVNMSIKFDEEQMDNSNIFRAAAGEGKDAQKKRSFKSDVFSLGGSLWYLEIRPVFKGTIEIALVFFKSMNINEFTLQEYLQGLRLERVPSDLDESNIDPDCMDDHLEVSSLIKYYNNTKRVESAKEQKREKNLQKAERVMLPSILAFKTEFETVSGSSGEERVKSDVKKDLFYIVAKEDERRVVATTTISGSSLKCSIKLHAFNLWSCFITEIAYFCVDEISSVTDSELLRLKPDELHVILQIMVISKRHSDRVISSFILKWLKYNAYHPIELLKKIIDIPNWALARQSDIGAFLMTESIVKNKIIGDYIQLKLAQQKQTLKESSNSGLTRSSGIDIDTTSETSSSRRYFTKWSRNNTKRYSRGSGSGLSNTTFNSTSLLKAFGSNVNHSFMLTSKFDNLRKDERDKELDEVPLFEDVIEEYQIGELLQKNTTNLKMEANNKFQQLCNLIDSV